MSLTNGVTGPAPAMSASQEFSLSSEHPETILSKAKPRRILKKCHGVLLIC